MSESTTMSRDSVPDKNTKRNVFGGKKMAGKKWIQAAKEKMAAKGTEGSLRKEAGAKDGKDIPQSKLDALKAKAKKTGNGKLAKKVAFAENVRKA